MGDLPGLLRHDDLFHTAFVVDDLEVAMAELGPRYGVTWRQGGGEVRLTADGETRVAMTGFAISVEGPHHLELALAVPGTIYEPNPAGAPHHLGWWVEDVAAASDALEAAGLPAALVVTPDMDGVPPMAAYHRAGDGFYLEVVSTGLRRVLLGTP